MVEMEIRIVIMIIIILCTIASSSSAGIMMTIMMELFCFGYFDDNDGKALHYFVHLLKSFPHFISSLRFDSFSPYSPKRTSFKTASFTPSSPFLCGNVLKEIRNLRQNRNHLFYFCCSTAVLGVGDFFLKSPEYPVAFFERALLYKAPRMEVCRIFVITVR